MGRRRGSRWCATIVVVLVVSAVACTAPMPVGFPDGEATTVQPAAPDTVGPISFRGTEIVDAEGRLVQIHGINMVRKSAPFHVSPDEPRFDEDLRRMRASGFNGVRLGVWMASLMPEPGVIDESYLDEVERGLDVLAEAGMWVLLDFHQDVFTGMPDWATTPEAAALSPTLPGFEDGFWALAYFSPRSMRQWEDLFARVPLAGGRSAVDHMGDAVAATAARFADNPAVIGIDLLNEPWPGEAMVDCLVGSCPARYGELRSIYEDYTAKVRAAAPGMKVWWTPFNWGPPFQDGIAPSGDDVALAYHSYCLHTDGGEPVQPTPLEHTLCGAIYEAQTTDAQGLGDRWDTPVMLGEFGASASPLNTTRLAQLADEHRMSWMYWDDNYYRSAPEVVRSDLVRTYPQATAGEILEQRFDPATGEFVLRYRPDASVDAPTSIAVPGEAYPGGYTVALEGAEVTSEADSARLTVVADSGAPEVALRVMRTRADE